MVKALKHHLQNQESFEAESWYITSEGLKVYQVCSNDNRKLTFDLLRQGQISFHLYWETSPDQESFMAESRYIA